MAIPRELRNRVEKQDFDAVEEAWLERMAEDPRDLELFVGTARALVGVGDEERSRFLLEMLDDHLRDAGLLEVRLELLRRAGSLLLEPEEIHPAILDTLAGLHGDTPSFDGFVRAARLDKAPHDTPKTWEKVDRFRDLVAYDVGATVWMEGKGPGRVTEVNLELDSLKVEFAESKDLTVGFRAAPKMLRVLGPEHVLRRKLEEPEVLARLAEEEPVELLRITLESFDEPLAAGEIREHLSGLVPEASWTSWWATVRRHPQVVAHGKGRQRYSWTASTEDAMEAVWSRFEDAAPRDRLTLLRKEGQRDPDLARRMVEALAADAAEAAGSDPGLAFEIACALEREAPERNGELAAGDGARPTPEELVRGTDDPQGLLGGILDRGWRERAYRLLREHEAGWERVFAAMLPKEEDPRLLDLLADALEEDASPEARQELWRFVDATIAQASRNPAAFTWIAERATEDGELRGRSPLRLLQQLFAALADKRFAPYRSRLAPLVESGGTAPRLLDHLGPRQAERAEEAIHRAPALEAYQRDGLTNALHLRHPQLRREAEDEAIYSTPEAIEERRAELARLVKEELPANRKAIEEARALGDLRENFEYKSARQRHEYLSSRQAKLERELGLARPIDFANLDTSEVRIGTRVELVPRREEGANGEPREITILGPWDSKPEEDVLAYESDLARSLLGKRPGDTVEAAGAAYEVGAIHRAR